jgi:hypothetical protein
MSDKKENKKIKVTDGVLAMCEKLSILGNEILDDPDLGKEEKIATTVPVLKGISDALKTTQKLEDSSGMPLFDDDDDDEGDFPSLDTELLQKAKPKRKKKNKLEEEFEL